MIRKFDTRAEAEAFGFRKDVPMLSGTLGSVHIEGAYMPLVSNARIEGSAKFFFALLGRIQQTEIVVPFVNGLMICHGGFVWLDGTATNSASNLFVCDQTRVQAIDATSCYHVNGARNTSFRNCVAEGRDTIYAWYIVDYPGSTTILDQCWVEFRGRCQTVIRYIGDNSTLIVRGLRMSTDNTEYIINAKKSENCRIVVDESIYDPDKGFVVPSCCSLSVCDR